jgi:hypothetical protein
MQKPAQAGEALQTALQEWADGESRRFTASVSGGAMDGGGWILIDGSSGDARSGRDRKFTTGKGGEKGAGASRILDN